MRTNNELIDLFMDPTMDPPIESDELAEIRHNNSHFKPLPPPQHKHKKNYNTSPKHQILPSKVPRVSVSNMLDQRDRSPKKRSYDGMIFIQL